MILITVERTITSYYSRLATIEHRYSTRKRYKYEYSK